MDLWCAGVRLLSAVVLDALLRVWRFVEPGLRAIGACWCAGYTTVGRGTNGARRGWPRTRDALVRWRAARGLAEIDRFLDAQH